MTYHAFIKEFTMIERSRVITLIIEGRPVKFIEKYYLPLA